MDRRDFIAGSVAAMGVAAVPAVAGAADDVLLYSDSIILSDGGAYKYAGYTWGHTARDWDTGHLTWTPCSRYIFESKVRSLEIDSESFGICRRPDDVVLGEIWKARYRRHNGVVVPDMRSLIDALERSLLDPVIYLPSLLKAA